MHINNTKTDSIVEKLNVIVTDDHPFFRKGLSSVLRNFPFVKKVDEAGDGAEAIHLLKNGNYQLVFLDIEMPVMDGKIAASHIHKDFPDVRMIAISMNDDAYTIRQMYLNGCDGYLIKNSDEEVMLLAINTVMNGNKFFSPDIIQKLALEPDEATMDRARKNFDFTPAELRVIPFIKEEKTNKQIADELFLSVRTVENHRYNIFKKAEVNSLHEFIRFAVKHRV